MIVLHRLFRKRQDGVVAIMTIAYLVACGMICLLTLWGISVSTGAYNTLYGTTQSAAYTAASTTDPDTDGEQLKFLCGDGYDPVNGICAGGETFDNAVRAAQISLSQEVSGRFGLTFGGTSARFRDNRIYAYSLPLNPALSEDYYNQNTVSNSADRCIFVGTADEAVGPESAPAGTRLCWTLSSDVANVVNFESGVAVYMEANINCPLVCRNLTLRTAAGATTSQPER